MILPNSIFNLVEHFGMSINASSVRVVAVNSKGKIIHQAEQTSKIPLIDGDKVNHEVLVGLIKDVIKKANIHQKYAAICLPEKTAYTREYSLPKLPVSEIQEAINWQVSTIFPFQPEEIYTDWKLLQQTDTESKVVVVAIARTLLDGIRIACEAAGIKPISFEPSTSTLARSITTAGTSTIILEVDAEGSSATLVQDGVSSLTTTTSFSKSEDATALLTNISSSITSIIKRSGGTAEQKWEVCLTGEKAASKLAEVLAKKLEIPARILPIDIAEPAYHGAYLAAHTAIQAPESEKTINLLPLTLQNEYHLEAELVQAKTVVKLGMITAIITLLAAIGALVAATTIGASNTSQSSLIVVPAETGETGLNIPLLMQKAQKIVSLQLVKQPPTETMTEIISIVSKNDIRQYTYDAAKREVRMAIAGVDRSALYEIKNALEATGKVVKVTIPLSALSSEGAGDTVITLQIKEGMK